MKKILFLIGCLAFISGPSFAEDVQIPIEYSMKQGPSSSGNSNVERTAPNYLSAYYREDSNTIEICSDYDSQADVYLCDKTGATIDLVSSLNAVLYLPQGAKGYYYILIDTSEWYASGRILVK